MTNPVTENLVRLTNPAQSPMEVAAKGHVEVTVPVPLGAFSASWECLSKLIDDSPSGPEETRGREEEVRLLCATFWAVVDRLPLTTMEFLRWAAENDPSDGEYVDWFVGGCLSKDEEFRPLWELNDETLDALARAIPKAKAYNDRLRARQLAYEADERPLAA